jgi:hypothetical protein
MVLQPFSISLSLIQTNTRKMKAITLIMMTILLPMSLLAQEKEENGKFKRFDDGTETLANKKGGFGGFLEMNTMPVYLNAQPGLMAGGGFSLVFGHSLNLGFAGYGLISDIHSNTIDSAGNYYHLQNGYGGMTIEPVFFSKKLVHVSFPVLLGVGGTSFTNQSLYNENTYMEDSWMNPEMYFIARPGVNIEINLLRILRLDFGVNYRFTSGHDMQNATPSMLNGWSGNIGLKLGWF